MSPRHEETRVLSVPPQSPAAVALSRLRWLVHLRWVYAAAIALLAAVPSWLRGSRPRGDLLLAAAAYAAWNAGCSIVLRGCSRRVKAGRSPRTGAFTHLQIAVDLAFLTGLMHGTGGCWNALLAVIVFHLAVTASLLPRAQGYVQAAWAAVLWVAVGAIESFRPDLSPGTPLLGLVPGGRQDVLFLSAAAFVAAGSYFSVVFFVDAILSRLRRINRRLMDANRGLRALDLAKSRFLRISSHQLRGPLAAVHAMLSAMQAAGPLSETQTQMIGRIHDRSAEMMKQIDEMMLLSTIRESASETVPRIRVDVGEVLRDCAKEFQEESSHRSVTVSVEADGRPVVAAWEDAVETICMHLLGNAVKYTPAGGRVRAAARPRGDRVELEVSDTGIGIPAEQQDQVLREFFRATNARQVCGGTGLGLSIVQAVVERLGGWVAIESKLGEGTTVRVSLPAAPEAQPEKET